MVQGVQADPSDTFMSQAQPFTPSMLKWALLGHGRTRVHFLPELGGGSLG